MTTTTIGDLITVLYPYFYDLYRDEEIASVATATMINELLIKAPETDYAH